MVVLPQKRKPSKSPSAVSMPTAPRTKTKVLLSASHTEVLEKMIDEVAEADEARRAAGDQRVVVEAHPQHPESRDDVPDDEEEHHRHEQHLREVARVVHPPHRARRAGARPGRPAAWSLRSAISGSIPLGAVIRTSLAQEAPAGRRGPCLPAPICATYLQLHVLAGVGRLRSWCARPRTGSSAARRRSIPAPSLASATCPVA